MGLWNLKIKPSRNGENHVYSHNLPTYFWTEAVNMDCYIKIGELIGPLEKKTPYELWN